MIPTPAPAAHPWRGMLIFLAALFLFSGMDSTTKYMAMRWNAPLVVAIRYILQTLLILLLLAPAQGRKLVETRRRGLVLLRAACLVLASLFMSLALQRMPVAETTALVFLGPLLVTLLAWPVLGEWIGPAGWVAAIGGFGGVLLVARPGSGLDPVGLACMAVTVAATAVYQLLSRMLAPSERQEVLLFYASLVGAVGFGALLPMYWFDRAPEGKDLLLFLGMGAVGAFSHFLFSLAYKYTPASQLAPLNYVQLLWAGLLGWLIFGQLPDRTSLLGMAVILASGILAALRSRPASPFSPPGGRQSAEPAKGG
jgi:drug/metabolite transporter (DMT)-like permease